LLASFWLYLRKPFFNKYLKIKAGNSSLDSTRLIRLGGTAFIMMKRVTSNEKPPAISKLDID
jgi:hypothetical protein